MHACSHHLLAHMYVALVQTNAHTYLHSFPHAYTHPVHSLLAHTVRIDGHGCADSICLLMVLAFSKGFTEFVQEAVIALVKIISYLIMLFVILYLALRP